MQLIISPDFKKFIEEEPVEMVERKGIGHPDSLADMIAEDFSSRYSNYCLRNFGVVLNHWVDKVVLAGAKARIRLGSAKIVKPINAYLFGKVTMGIGKRKIDVLSMFEKSVRDVLIRAIRDKGILKFVDCHIDINDSIGLDHSKEFYSPASANKLSEIEDMKMANDSVIVSAHAPYSLAELLAIRLENYINSDYFKKEFPDTGCDVKVLIVRIKNCFNITICLPFKASCVTSFASYKRRLKEARGAIEKTARNLVGKGNLELFVNTKDSNGHGYITVFGTALDKGDCGVTGRGNRFNGIISLNREMNLEAVSGKNPVCHAGKLYNYLAQKVANEIYSEFKLENYVNIACKNGELLNNPSFIVVKFYNENFARKDKIRTIVSNELSAIHEYYKDIIGLGAIDNFRMEKTLSCQEA